MLRLFFVNPQTYQEGAHTEEENNDAAERNFDLMIPRHSQA
jgi:hypothetical protein